MFHPSFACYTRLTRKQPPGGPRLHQDPRSLHLASFRRGEERCGSSLDALDACGARSARDATLPARRRAMGSERISTRLWNQESSSLVDGSQVAASTYQPHGARRPRAHSLREKRFSRWIKSEGSMAPPKSHGCHAPQTTRSMLQ